MTGAQRGIKIAAIALAIFIIFVIISGIFMLFGAFSYSDGYDFINTYTNVQEVEIDLSSAQLEIRSGSEFKVQGINVSDRFRVREKEHTINIDEESFRLFGGSDSKVIIYVPNYLDELKIDSGSGVVSIKDIEVRYLELDQGAGVIEVDNATFDKVEIDGGIGEFTARNSVFSDMELGAGLGEVNIEAKILGSSKIDSGMGDVNLTLLGGEELYEIRLDKGLGDFNINGSKYKYNSYGTGLNKIKIDNGVGSINIDFK